MRAGERQSLRTPSHAGVPDGQPPLRGGPPGWSDGAKPMPRRDRRMDRTRSRGIAPSRLRPAAAEIVNVYPTAAADRRCGLANALTILDHHIAGRKVDQRNLMAQLDRLERGDGNDTA